MLPPDQPAAKATQVADDLVSPALPDPSALRRLGSSGSSTQASANPIILSSSGLSRSTIRRIDRQAHATATLLGSKYAQTEIAACQSRLPTSERTKSSVLMLSSAAPTSPAADG